MKARPMQDRVLIIRGVDALELDAEVLADHLAASGDGDRLVAIALWRAPKPGAFHRRDLEAAAQRQAEKAEKAKPRRPRFGLGAIDRPQ
jgi:hypothetical protein